MAPMKKILFSLAVLILVIGCQPPLQERILGIWERTAVCTSDGQCQTSELGMAPKLSIFRPGLAIYENPADPENQRRIEYEFYEKETKSKSPEIIFRFLNLGFDIRYIVKRADKEYLELYNPDRNNTEVYKKLGPAPE
ncbi:hypothetical protein EHQ64_04730 [Leptospira sarikeiensis]|uniref:Lipoprotein n=2 Tax=Leptospira sarikeiensis TaxID=2484943 RepID=A0A4R9KAI7_9LEPT|nr:hypothetical protein EHQ64_04730 [Leptospira sarikeiensis]